MTFESFIIPLQEYRHVRYDEVHRKEHRARVNDLLSDPIVPGSAAQALPGSGSILPIRAHRLYAQRNPLRWIALLRMRSIVVVTRQVPSVRAEIAVALLRSGASLGVASFLLPPLASSPGERGLLHLPRCLPHHACERAMRVPRANAQVYLLPRANASFRRRAIHRYLVRYHWTRCPWRKEKAYHYPY